MKRCYPTVSQREVLFRAISAYFFDTTQIVLIALALVCAGAWLVLDRMG